MEQFHCVIFLVVLCGLFTRVSANSLIDSRISELEKQLSDVANNVKSLSDDVVTIMSMFLEQQSMDAGEAHGVKKRATIDGDPLADLPDELKGIIGPPGKDGSVGAMGPAGPPGPPGPAGKAAISSGGGGAVYTRWGRTTCGSDSTLLYKGYTGGSAFDHAGGGTNYQCMPLDPKYNKYSTPFTFIGSWIAGVEYETHALGIFPNSAYNQNAPCARCYTDKRSTVMMIPAKRDCLAGWTKEYEGYLMSAFSGHNHQTTFECVDESPEYVHGKSADKNGGLFYFVRTSCSAGGQCPPYDGTKEITCVVCSK